MSNPIITLTTDYGTVDNLVGILKGVILGIVPSATIVDISHHVLPFDILDGALAIGSAYQYFPPRTIHIIVVDPGVGTPRRPLLVTAEQHSFVAPDNGVLSMVYEREPNVQVRHITATHYFQNPVSNTFHGRDIFAPAGAWLAKTRQADPFGEAISDYVRFAIPRAKASGTTIKGLVLRVDAFGNLVTNLTSEDLPPASAGDGKIKLSVGGKTVEQMVQYFAQGSPGVAVAVLGSSGFLEIAVNKGNAARTLGVNRGSEITLELS